MVNIDDLRTTAVLARQDDWKWYFHWIPKPPQPNTMFCCSCSTRTFSSERAIAQHYLARHNLHLCMVSSCFRSFATDGALQQHTASAHGVRRGAATSQGRHQNPRNTPPSNNLLHAHDPPIPNASGYWVPREAFTGNKSFGRFRCVECAKAWGSAHAFPEYPQGCQRCETTTLPCCLWVNNERDTRELRNSDSESGEDGPHDKIRCGKCLALGRDCRGG
jgi:hypothetical protein